MLNTTSFETICLSDMDQVKLMNRTDRKFWFHINYMQDILDVVTQDYFILNIDGEDKMPYSTTYFDTRKNEMFTNHHNGKLNRHKIRKRSYLNSGISFLEIKFKNNKGRTIKKRIPTSNNFSQFTSEENKFIKSKSNYSIDDLSLALINGFSRITLVNKNFKERCTIDFNLHFQYTENKVMLNDLVIVEIKADGNSEISPLALALRNHHIKASGFSKYCMGRTITDNTLKRNAFKPKIRKIEKILQYKFNIYKTA